MNRRAFLRLCAATTASAAAGARAAPCEPPPAFPDRGQAGRWVAFLEDSDALQGARLDEFRNRLAARGLGDDRLRVEPVLVRSDDPGAVRCALQAALARRPLAACTASTQAALLARPHLGDVPLLFATTADPVAAGLVDGAERREANAAGFTYDTPVPADRKCLELIAEAFPATRRVVVIADGAWLARPRTREELRLATARFGFELEVVAPVVSWRIAAALHEVEVRPQDAWYLPRGDALLHGVGPIMHLLQRHRLPHLFGEDRTIRSGALMAYGPPRLAHWEALAAIVQLVAAGAAAREIPIQRPSDFLLTLNAAQWQRFGIPLPRRILRRAHEIV